MILTTDASVVMAALAAFGALLIAWLILPIPTVTEQTTAPHGRPREVPIGAAAPASLPSTSSSPALAMPAP